MQENGKWEDESWKKQARREKEQLDAQLRADKEKRNRFPPEPAFSQFIGGLAAQAFVALGETENPLTKKREVDLHQAKYLIDVVALLRNKTRGNLDEAESAAIEQLLTDLRLRFVKAADGAKG